MITIPIWQVIVLALLVGFVAFCLGVALMAAFAAAGDADDRIAQREGGGE